MKVIAIADKIKILREGAGLTQKELSDQLGITRSSVNAWELGISIPSTQYIVKLSNLFSVSTDYLLNVGSNENISLIGLTEEETRIIIELINCFKKKK